MGLIISITFSIVIPIVLCIYALVKRQALPFILGVIAFTVSQVLLRIPLLQLLSQHSIQFSVFQMTSPIIFLAVIALSAGLFEETARWIAMKLFMSKKQANAAIFFGLGHGGIEALLIVGVPLVMQISMLMLTPNELNLYMGAMERAIAIVLHVCFSVIVFFGIKQKKLIYLLLAIILHGLTNFTVVLLSSHMNLILVELVFLLITALLVIFSMYLMRRLKRDEKKIVNGIN